ncbi:MAG: hypothetical protein KTR27_11555 [Leptolyngbyaceae cyanobacterium MAG.088]|nr:hypothetical protein [Leptolyngbyaceae cyanobacterium MAG.088]
MSPNMPELLLDCVDLCGNLTARGAGRPEDGDLRCRRGRPDRRDLG